MSIRDRLCLYIYPLAFHFIRLLVNPCTSPVRQILCYIFPPNVLFSNDQFGSEPQFLVLQPPPL